MKLKCLLVISTMMLMSIPPYGLAQATTPVANRLVVSNYAPLPDLITFWSLVGNPKNGKFEIRIKNTGAANAAESYVVLKVYHVASPGAKPTEKSYHAKVPAIAAGQQADVVIETRLDLSLDKSCTIADGTNKVAESNENNNRICGDVDS